MSDLVSAVLTNTLADSYADVPGSGLRTYTDDAALQVIGRRLLAKYPTQREWKEATSRA